MNSRTLPGVVALIAVIASPLKAPAQTAGNDSLCIHFTAETRAVHLSLVGGVSLNGTLPLTLCDLLRGERYDLVVRGRGLELRRGYFSIGDSGAPRGTGNRIGTFMRNAVVPGWGSMRAGRSESGWTDLASLGAIGYAFYREHTEWQHLENRHTVLTAQLADAPDAEELQRIRLHAYIASRDVNVQNRYRQRLAVFAAYVYGFQLIDPWLLGNPPKLRVEAGGTVVRVGAARLSGAKAFALSLLRPGRGQFYQGKSGRGIFFSLMSTVGGLVALDFHDKYDVAVNRYESNRERFEAAETISQQQTLRDREPGLWDDVENRKRERNIAYGVLAGIWAAGVIDTFLPGREDAPPTNLTFDVGPGHAFIVYRF